MHSSQTTGFKLMLTCFQYVKFDVICYVSGQDSGLTNCQSLIGTVLREDWRMHCVSNLLILQSQREARFSVT